MKQNLFSKKNINIALLLLLFAISIAVRYANLKAPLDRREEWQTGHVLTTLSIWEQNGIANHNFSPVWTFNSPGDKITNSLGGLRDQQGYTYYVSYPPFSFILPYFVFKITGQAVCVGGIRVFSLLIHFLCALLIFLIVYKFFSKTIKNDLFIPAHVAFCFYIFATGNLWFHGNFYFADTLVHLFVLSTLYLVIFIIEQPDKNLIHKNLLLFTLLFFGIYTEWLALFFTSVMAVFFVLTSLKNKIYLNYLFTSVLATILSVSLIIYQYSKIAGFQALIDFWYFKFNGRSGFDELNAIDGSSIYVEQSYKDIYANYLSNYNYLGDFTLLCAFAFLILLLVNHKTKKVEVKFSPIVVLGLISIAILVHHFMFFNFTVIHDISTLKITIPVCLFLGYFFGVVFEYGNQSKNLVSGFSILFCSAFIFYSSREYLIINSGHNDAYAQKLVGEAACKYSKPDEIVFTNVGISPVMMWHAKRNVMPSLSTNGCLKTLDSLHYQKGIFLKVSSQNKRFLLKIIRVNSSGDTLAIN